MTHANSKHPVVRRIIALRRRQERDLTGLFFAEGVRFLLQAVEHSASIETVLISPAMLTSSPARKVVERLGQAGIEVVEVTPEVFAFLSLSESPQGMGIVVRQRWTPLREIQPDSHDRWLVLDSVNSPGNLGTMLRTVDAAGGRGVILLGNDVDPYDSAAVRASMGAIFSREMVRVDLDSLLRWKRRFGVRLIGTSSRTGIDYRTPSYDGSIGLYLGCEQRGIATERLALCDTVVSIPMVGSAGSLNVAVAAGILLFEAQRGGLRPDSAAGRAAAQKEVRQRGPNNRETHRKRPSGRKSSQQACKELSRPEGRDVLQGTCSSNRSARNQSPGGGRSCRSLP